jgi:hypothetical protein
MTEEKIYKISVLKILTQNYNWVDLTEVVSHFRHTTYNDFHQEIKTLQSQVCYEPEFEPLKFEYYMFTLQEVEK